MASYFSNLIEQASNSGELCARKKALAEMAYWKFGKAQKNCIQMIADLLEPMSIDWEEMLCTLLERLSVINNERILISNNSVDTELNICRGKRARQGI